MKAFSVLFLIISDWQQCLPIDWHYSSGTSQAKQEQILAYALLLTKVIIHKLRDEPFWWNIIWYLDWCLARWQYWKISNLNYFFLWTKVFLNFCLNIVVSALKRKIKARKPKCWQSGFPFCFKRGYGQTGSKAHLPAVSSIFDLYQWNSQHKLLFSRPFESCDQIWTNTTVQCTFYYCTAHILHCFSNFFVYQARESRENSAKCALCSAKCALCSSVRSNLIARFKQPGKKKFMLRISLT